MTCACGNSTTSSEWSISAANGLMPRSSASTNDDDARGEAGWPRGESCHVAHGTLLRVRLRHRTRTHGGSLGAAVARAAWKGARAHLLARPQSTPPLRQLGAIQRLRVGKGYYQAAGPRPESSPAHASLGTKTVYSEAAAHSAFA